MIILDTNVLSELMLRRPHQNVMRWADSQRRNDLVTTAITEMELHSGVQLIKPSKRRIEIAAMIDWAFNELLGGRVLAFDRKAALASAGWYAKRRAMGRSIDTKDAQIAGIALARRIPIATRNVAHFDGLDVKVFDPWSASP